LKSLLESLPGENQLIVVSGADHFFAGKLDDVDRAITHWVAARLRQLSP